MGGGEVAWVRVIGPGICRESGRFEELLRQVEQLGFATLVIELSRCPRMDSTFAGALLRLAARAEAGRPDGRPLRVVLSGATEQVAELLDTLFLDGVFERAELPTPEAVTPLDVEARDLPREQILALSLDGHERLAALSEANARRFGALLSVLREQLAATPHRPPAS